MGRGRGIAKNREAGDERAERGERGGEEGLVDIAGTGNEGDVVAPLPCCVLKFWVGDFIKVGVKGFVLSSSFEAFFQVDCFAGAEVIAGANDVAAVRVGCCVEV